MINRYPLAVVSLVIGILSFVQLFGMEKAILAIVLGLFALRSVSPEQEAGKKYAYIGIILGSLYILVLLVILIVKGPGLIALLGQMKQH